jgi:hypothetical protein
MVKLQQRTLSASPSGANKGTLTAVTLPHFTPNCPWHVPRSRRKRARLARALGLSGFLLHQIVEQ